MLPFKRHPQLDFGFVWRQDLEDAKRFVVAGLPLGCLKTFSLGPDVGRRSTAAYHALNSNPNEVLGDLVSGRPTQQITGSFSIFVTEYSGDQDVVGDVLPSDLHEALYRVALIEVKHGKVKIPMDASVEEYYGGGTF